MRIDADRKFSGRIRMLISFQSLELNTIIEQSIEMQVHDSQKFS